MKIHFIKNTVFVCFIGLTTTIAGCGFSAKETVKKLHPEEQKQIQILIEAYRNDSLEDLKPIFDSNLNFSEVIDTKGEIKALFGSWRHS